MQHLALDWMLERGKQKTFIKDAHYWDNGGKSENGFYINNIYFIFTI